MCEELEFFDPPLYDAIVNSNDDVNLLKFSLHINCATH